jgi:TRAP-type C4-dicarboxylate transport system permease small subunit
MELAAPGAVRATPPARREGLLPRLERGYTMCLKGLVLALAGVSGLGILAMIGVTCADVVLRAFGGGLTGSYDLVKISGGIAIAASLPYTTAVKGHVAIEFFFQKMRPIGRIVVDTICRLMVICFFIVVTWQCLVFGAKLHRTHEVSLTLQIPVFWVAYVLAFCAGVTVLVKIHNLLHPGREMIKP